MRTDIADRFIKADPQPLARHLQKSEMADRSDLDPRPVVPHRIFHAAFDGIAVLVLFHIDEIDNDQAGQVAKAQLASQLVSCLKIGLERRFLNIPLTRRAARVDVDSDKRFGLVDHQIPA